MTVQTYVTYDTDPGAVTGVGYGPPEHIEQQAVLMGGILLVDGSGPQEPYFIENGQLIPCADYLVGALPLPCTVTIEGVEYPCTAQPTFAFNYPGDYEIRVNAGFRYLEKTFVINQP